MPWKELSALEQRLKLVADWLKGNYTIMELSYSYGVSRKTVYKWLLRYQYEQADGLKERSRAPFNHPNATPSKVVDLIVKAKQAYPGWGAKKLLARLEREQPEYSFPALV